jgi:crossover junction endodeoxyribonuclease RusA
VSHPIPTEVETRLTLPFPPSVNRLYRAVGGRSILSETYRAWRAEAGTLLMAQRPKKMTGPVSVTVELKPRDKRRRDIDNCGFKAVLDLLVTMRIIEADDNTCVREITGRWVDAGQPCTVIVRSAE